MLTNFVTDVDLRRYYPKISGYLWSGQADYTTQINEAFELVLDDLRAREIDPRRMHIPIDLNRPIVSTANQDRLTVLTQAAALTSTHVVGIVGFRRFGVSVSALTGTSGYSIKLQGSDDIDVSETKEPVNWEDVGTLSPTAAGTLTTIIVKEYRYYRIMLAVPVTTPSITFSAFLLETYVDRWIIWRAFQMIFQDFSKEKGDLWDERARTALQRYEQALSSAKFGLDTNKDNLITSDDASPSNAQTDFTR